MGRTFIRPLTIGVAAVLVAGATGGAALASAGHGNGRFGGLRAGFDGTGPGGFGLGGGGGPRFGAFGQGGRFGQIGGPGQGGGFGAGLGLGRGAGAGGSRGVSVLDADVLDPAASYLGISASTLESDLAGGKTLAQVVTAVGGSKTTAGLIAAIVASEQGVLAADQTAGWITSAQETSLLSAFTTEVTDLVNSGPPVPPASGEPQGGLLQTAATFLGVSLSTLQSDLSSGKTLAQVAAAQGKQVADLVTALEAAPTARLDAAVKAGTITSAQESTILTNLTTRLTAIVNGTGANKNLTAVTRSLARFVAVARSIR
jgi:hypothetical protein